MDVSLRSLAWMITAALLVSNVTGLMPSSWSDVERYPQRKSWSDVERYPQRNTWFEAERYPQRKSWSDVERYPQRKSWSDAEQYQQRKSWSDLERYPQRKSWSGFPFRREVELTECNSYTHLMELVMNEFRSYVISGFNEMSDHNKPVTRDILRSFSNAMCRDLANVVLSLKETIKKCPNAEQVEENLHIFGGLCTGEGETTPFLDTLISDFDTSFGLTPPCLENQVYPVLQNCTAEEMEPQKDLVGGPKAYKRIIKEQEKCNFEGFDDIDIDVCGDIASLKKLAIILDIFFNIGPGVTFSMYDFQF